MWHHRPQVSRADSPLLSSQHGAEQCINLDVDLACKLRRLVYDGFVEILGGLARGVSFSLSWDACVWLC